MMKWDRLPGSFFFTNQIFPKQFEPHHWGVYQPMFFPSHLFFFGFTTTVKQWIFWGAFSAPKICTVLEGCLAKLIRDLGWYGSCFKQRRKMEKGADEVYSCWMFSLEDVFLVVDDFFEYKTCVFFSQSLNEESCIYSEFCWFGWVDAR